MSCPAVREFSVDRNAKRGLYIKYTQREKASQAWHQYRQKLRHLTAAPNFLQVAGVGYWGCQTEYITRKIKRQHGPDATKWSQVLQEKVLKCLEIVVPTTAQAVLPGAQSSWSLINHSKGAWGEFILPVLPPSSCVLWEYRRCVGSPQFATSFSLLLFLQGRPPFSLRKNRPDAACEGMWRRFGFGYGLQSLPWWGLRVGLSFSHLQPHGYVHASAAAQAWYPILGKRDPKKAATKSAK